MADMRLRYAAHVSRFQSAFFAEVNHVRAEQRLARLGVVLFSSFQQTVNPRQQFARTVVRVQNHRHAVGFRKGVDVVRTGHSAKHSGPWSSRDNDLPALNLAPPFENWMMTGELTALAVSITALMLLLPITFTAGNA